MATSRKKIIIVAVIVLAAALIISRLVLFLPPSHITFTGFVEGEDRIVRSEVTGRVLFTYFEEGSTVKKGDLLALLDMRDIYSQIQQKRFEIKLQEAQIVKAEQDLLLTGSNVEGTIKTTRSDMKRAKSDFELASKNYERIKNLHVRQVATDKELDDARNAFETTQKTWSRDQQQHGIAIANRRQLAIKEADLEVQRRQLDLSREMLHQLLVTLSKFKIRAPLDGTVQTQYIYSGELAQPGTPIAGILNNYLDKYIRIYVPVPLLSKIAMGMKVDVRLDSHPKDVYKGVVYFIEEQATFTPKNIELKEDRVMQVYRTKVKILERMEDFKEGEEGDVILHVRKPVL